MKMEVKHFRCFFLLLAVVLVCTACKNARIAATIALTKTEGELELIDRRGRDVLPKENLHLFDGYIMATHEQSYAWMDLDSKRLVKLDQESQMGIQKNRKKLEIIVQHGNLFFNIEKPLEEDESLDIRTSSMMVGIRGTCGWVEVLTDEGIMRVYLLEGKVECTAGDRQEMIQAGEVAVMTAAGEVSISKFTQQDIPDFVMEELLEDEDLRETIEEALDLSGWDGLNPSESDSANLSSQDEQNPPQQDVLNSQEVMDALEQYRNVIRNIYAYQFPYSEPAKIRQCALVKMERKDRVPTLLLLSEPAEGVENMYAFQYDPDSRSVFQINGFLTQGVASAGGFRGEIGMEADGNGILAVQWSSGTGQGTIKRVTIEGNVFHDVTQLEGLIVGIERPEELIARPIEWHDIDRLEWMDNWKFDADPYGEASDIQEITEPQTGEAPWGTPGNRPYTTAEPETSVPETAAAESSTAAAEPSTSAAETLTAAAELPTDGNRIVFTGTFNIYTHDQVVALQGSPDPNGSGGSENYRIIVLDVPQSMTLFSADPTSEAYTGSVRMISVENGSLDAYAGQHLTFSVNPDATYWPSDTSLPLGEPHTRDVRVLN